LDTIDRRAEEVKLLGLLATVVAATGKPLWYSGRTQEVPPQIEDRLDAYLDRSHATMLAVIPLYAPDHRDARGRRSGTPRPLGALVVEQLSDNRAQHGMAERAETVAVHGASALHNALEHESLFLLPLWRALGKTQWVVQARTLPKTILAAAALASVVAGLVLTPADFDLAARGKLHPSVRRDVFAHIDGVVVKVPVRHEQLVQPGQVLLRLSNNRLEAEISNAIGRKRTTQERIRNVQRAQLDGRHLRIEEQNRLAGELLELRQVEESIDRELALLRRKEQQLIVRSEMTGQVVTWNVGDTLLRRPVQTGQLLMTIVDLAGEWELELYMPERRVGHVARAAALSRDGLHVTFIMASHPDRRLTGRVVEIHRTAEVRGDEGNSVLMRVAIDKDDLPELRSQTSVTARVHCGRRSIGYVLFHELIETVHSKVLFWL
jgi:multidrug resistance efflux pump